MVPFERDWMLAKSAEVGLTDGLAGSALLNSIETRVPPRGVGRENWHRERLCIVLLMRHLAKHAPRLFPGSLIQQQAPDFVFRPYDGQAVLAIEHTDAGSSSFQSGMDEFAHKPSPRGFFSFDPGRVAGEEVEIGFRSDLLEAIVRKSKPKFWQHAPMGSRKVLLVSDQIEGSDFIEDQDARSMVGNIFAECVMRVPAIDAVALIRGDRRVLTSTGTNDLAP
jgi:hypothetical protein